MRTPVKVLFAAFAVGFLAMSAWAQDLTPMALQDAINGYESVTNGHAGVIDDWSTHHLVFSQPVPGTPTYDKVVHDPRYWMQQIRRHRMESDASVANDAQTDDLVAGWDITAKKKKKKQKPKKIPLKGDWTVSLGASTATVGAGNYPSKFYFLPSTASCSDFVVFNTSLPGTTTTVGTPGTQATIIAVNNLYASCTGTPPSVLWSYNTGNPSNTAIVTNSVVVSADGKQVAFILSSSSGASLEVLRPVAGQGTSATAPAVAGTTSATGAGYVTCKMGAGSCLLSLPFLNAVNDTNSSPFYVYYGTQGDQLYVGDDTGHLHQFTGVFNGTPAETHTGTTIPFATTAVGHALTSPVFDTTSGNVFFGDARTGGSGGNLYRSTSTGSTGTITTSTTTPIHGVGMIDGPLVDSTAARAYCFGLDDGAGNAGVFQFPTTGTFAGTETIIGATNSSSLTGYSGTFDNAYFSSSATSPTGGLWVCGTGAATTDPTLYKIAISGNMMPANGTLERTLTSGSATCSPVTEFFNSTSSTDFGFLSVTALGNITVSPTCSGACVYSFNFGATFANISGKASTGGASGIIIDNSQTSPGGSEIYYTPLTTTGAGIQATQSGLN